MANIYFSPAGNPEVWDEKPNNYYTPEEWAAAHPAPPQPEPTIEELQQQFTDAIQGYLDDFARTRNYDNILSAATYATSTVPKFRAEGQYAVEARDEVWATGYEILDAVIAGRRSIPGLEEVLSELPRLAWPEWGGTHVATI